MGVSSMSVNILNALNLVNVENLLSLENLVRRMGDNSEPAFAAIFHQILNLLARTRSKLKSIFQEKEKQDILIQIAQQTAHALYKTQ